MDLSDKNAKLSDSAYSNSCNSQSRKSRSSKSTHSGSNSSGSSGYCGVPSTSGIENPPPEKRAKDKDTKKNKQVQPDVVEVQVEEKLVFEPASTLKPPIKNQNEVDQTSPSTLSKKDSENMDVASTASIVDKEVLVACESLEEASMKLLTYQASTDTDGFSCVISMHDGVVMYTTPTLTNTLGFPKNMWIGRSFIDFIHIRDRNTFASQITNGLAVPKTANGTQEKDTTLGNTTSTMVCRIRRYKGLNAGFGVKERILTFMPFALKLTFKNVTDDNGEVMYLVVQATPLISAFKESNEVMTNPTPFVIRHAATGSLEYIDQQSVSYLGYMPQDVVGKDALMLYHPDDLCYLRQVYEIIVKEGSMARSKPYRMMTQNRDYVKVETEWSSFINPWSKKLEFVIGKHHIINGPCNPDVFQTPEVEKVTKNNDEDKKKQQATRESIVKTMNEVLTKPAELAKQQITKRCLDLATFMESLLNDQPKVADELCRDIRDADQNNFDKDFMLGGISPHHDFNDSKCSTETPPSYNQLNYNENLHRYFDSHQSLTLEDYKIMAGESAFAAENTGQRGSLFSLSPAIQSSSEASDANTSNGPTAKTFASEVYHTVRLTETVLTKHDTEMEKKLVKRHREMRTHSKMERGKNTNENKQRKKKEHLAICNASYQPTGADAALTPEPSEKKMHGVKRTSKASDEDCVPHKLHCPPSRQTRRKPIPATTCTTETKAPSDGATVAVIRYHPKLKQPNNTNTYVRGIRHPVSIMSSVVVQPMAAMTGLPVMCPMYYAPAPNMTMSAGPNVNYNNGNMVAAAPANPADQQQFENLCMSPMYYAPAPNMTMSAGPNVNYNNGNMVAASPAIPANQQQFENSSMSPMYYAPTTNMTMSVGPNVNYNNENMIAASPAIPANQQQFENSSMFQMYYNTAPNMTMSAGPNVNYNNGNMAAASPAIPANQQQFENSMQSMAYEQSICDNPFMYGEYDPQGSDAMQPTMMSQSMLYNDMQNQYNPLGLMTSNYEQTTEAPLTPTPTLSVKSKRIRPLTTEDTVDRTDGESSYSSFYSSFFKTESGSAEDSDTKKSSSKLKTATTEFWNKPSSPYDQTPKNNSYYGNKQKENASYRNVEPPWLDQVCVTSDLQYKYQIAAKPMTEVLLSDKQKLNARSQSSLVNEQLGQLYQDLRLEGVAARLTLEEGITSSSSSGEESIPNIHKVPQRKREHSKLVMIYEEDAPFPPTDEESRKLRSATPVCK